MVVVEFEDETLLEESDSPPSDDMGGETRPHRSPTRATLSVSGEELEDKLGRVVQL